MSDDPFVIVGASLAGLRAAEALREGGYAGRLVIVGEEPHFPYDRPPLSKQVPLGIVAADRTALPRLWPVEAEWRLGVRATGVDLSARRLSLSTGQSLRFAKLLVATGTRARPWHVAEEQALEGVMTLRTREDGERLEAALIAYPQRVVIIGGGFTGSELASACRELDLSVTLIERSATPLFGALGAVVGGIAASLHKQHGVDLRCGAEVERIEGDKSGRVRRVHLKHVDEPIEAELVIVALGSLPNIEWLVDSGLDVGPRGLACDAECRAIDRSGQAVADIYTAGDVGCFPHPLFDGRPMALEHWGNAVEMAQVAAHNMLEPPGARRAHEGVPAFWSSQFGINIKCVGVPALGDQVMFLQGSAERAEFVALYGHRGRLVAAVGFDQGKWIGRYAALIETGAAFPCGAGMDPSADPVAVPAGFGLHGRGEPGGANPAGPAVTALSL